MTGDHSQHQGDPTPGAGQAWAALGYLISGMAVWGFAGWLVDRWLGSDGIVTAVGIMVGVAGGIYLIMKRMGPS
ncbi:MAG TPA: AtpZ/AtpI family protein [Micromonosporaceae bacterium]